MASSLHQMYRHHSASVRDLAVVVPQARAKRNMQYIRKIPRRCSCAGWAAPVLLLVLLSLPVQARDDVIKSDSGGLVQEYAAEFRRIAASGDRVVIDGPCMSACTMAVAIPTTCITKRAVLGFHMPYELGGEFLHVFNLQAAQFLLDL